MINPEDTSGTTPGFYSRKVLTGNDADKELLGEPAVDVSSTKRRSTPIIFQPITGPQSSVKANPSPKDPALKEPTLTETPSPKEPVLITRGGAPPENPISQGILNLLFICFLYWVSTKILLFYGISNDIYLVYFMFYVFLYVTTLLLPTSYERFD